MNFESWYAGEQAWNSFDNKSLEELLRAAWEAGRKFNQEEIRDNVPEYSFRGQLSGVLDDLKTRISSIISDIDYDINCAVDDTNETINEILDS